jgi:hypothetical protein
MAAMDDAPDPRTRPRLDDLALVRGIADTKAALARWNAAPGRVVGGWAALALAIALSLLLAVWAVASLSTPDTTRYALAGVTREGTLDDVVAILVRNSLVLALHSLACVAGFIAGSSLPLEAERHRGLWRKVHDRAGPLAIAFVGGATLFSLTTQAYVLGGHAADLANQFGMSPALFLLALSPHALPELTAVFLPLAAWLVASRGGRWHELLAATIVTTALAAPVVVGAAYVEVYVSPHLVRALGA